MTEARYLLDSNICIYILGDLEGRASRTLAAQIEGSVVTSTIVVAEVLRGMPTEDVAGRLAVEALFGSVTPLPFERHAAEIYATLSFKRASFDRLIAAHALALDATLVTNNIRDFADIPGLRIEDWTQ